MKLYDLKVNGVEEPLGYAYDYLTFSWRLSAKEVLSNLTFCLEISKDSSFDEILVIEKTDTVNNQLTVSSDFLEARTTYFWRISADGVVAKSTFETGKMAENWSADWTSYEGDARDSVAFSKIITLDKTIAKARLYTLGFGLYEAELNGQKIGDEYLTPGYHSYDLMEQYQTYDLTQLLKRENQLRFILGNGWYKGRFVFEGGFENLYGNKQKLIAELVVDYVDGTQDVIVTDESWLSETTIYRENNIYDGEVVDYAGLVEPLTTIVLGGPKEKLTERLDPPVQVVETFEPSVFRDKSSNLVLDYGQVITGWLSGVLPAGKEKVVFRFGELLQDGSFYRDNLRTAKSEWVLYSNPVEQVVRPRFTYFGFRYVCVEGLDEAEAGQFVAQALQSQMDEIFQFESSNVKLNQLLSNIRWSQKSNFLSIPTDCPQRDERMGWTGDITVFSNTASYNMETRAFLGHFLKNLHLEQQLMDGAVPFFAPFPKVEPFDGINPFLVSSGAAVWADAATVLPITLYRHFRDKGLLESHVPMMRAWVDYLYRHDQERGGKRLWDYGFQLGDWLALDTGHPEVPFGATDNALIATIYYYRSCKYTAQALRILEDPEADFYENLAQEIRKTLLETYFVGDSLNDQPITLHSEAEIQRQNMAKHFGIAEGIRTKIGSQTGLSLLLREKIYPSEKARLALRERLREELRQTGGHLNTGFAGTPELPHALVEEGLYQEAFNLLFKETTPSWLFEVNLGATTTWERWNSLLPDGTIIGTDMNSMNHYAYGAVQDFIVEKMLGIQLPSADATDEIVTIEPFYTEKLEKLAGKLQTPNGWLKVQWSLKESTVEVIIDVPVRTSVSFKSQLGEVYQLTSGRHVIEDQLLKK
ncbi:family 78 glycoside hydrolase catalytic domain [Streptococcus merionis]|uniref:family 78 glycoside hydrolase catalytic domain n=1 Tax=Streptococcus merionis TaxID=400065 RepID=UPI0026F0F157|nr:family 78 glycoside hydrolase catalytic domain [Streptococcus merionis]